MCHGSTVIDRSLVITGTQPRPHGRAILNADEQGRVVKVERGVKVTTRDLVVTGGDQQRRHLVMNDASSIHDNVTSGCVSEMCGPAGASGARVPNTGTLILRATASIHHNRAGGPAQGLPPEYPGARSGGVYNEGTVR